LQFFKVLQSFHIRSLAGLVKALKEERPADFRLNPGCSGVRAPMVVAGIGAGRFMLSPLPSPFRPHWP